VAVKVVSPTANFPDDIQLTAAYTSNCPDMLLFDSVTKKKQVSLPLPVPAFLDFLDS
jgi:hypothetical protein